MSDGDQFTNPVAPPDTIIVADLVASESDPRKKAQLEAVGQNEGGWFSNIWGKFWASVYDGLAYLMTEFASSLDQVLAFVGKFFLLGQGEKNAAFYDLAGTILEDLTGVPVDKAALKNSAFGSGRLAGMQTFGADLYNLLEEEFKPISGNLETPDSAPAQRFLGFLMNFAIRQGNIELLTSLLPEGVRVGDGFRAYGELMAKNLGLGRMAARAFRPLPQILVADPLTAKLNAQYRPKRMPKEQAIKAWWRGAMTEAEMRKELAEEGYNQARQDFMIVDSRPMLSDGELIDLGFRHFIEDAEMRGELQKRGWKAEDLDKLIESKRPQPKEADFFELYLSGWIERADVTIALEQLGYRPDAAEVTIKAFDMRHFLAPHPKHPPAPHRTFNQLRKEFLDGVITLTEVQNQLTNRGYNDDDITAMTLDLLLDQQGRRATRATRAVPSLTWAQMKAAYKAGVVDIEEVKVHLTHRGYSADDIAILLKELPATATSTTTPTA